MSSNATIFKHVKHKATDGRPPIQYRIQLVDKSMIDEAASFIVKNCFARDNLSVSIDKQFGALETENVAWAAECLSKGLSLAAVLEDEQGNRGSIIGCNVLLLRRNYDSENQSSRKEDRSMSGDRVQRKEIIIQTMEDASSKVDVFTLYGCSSYIGSMGLGVAQEFEGRGVGGELLKARGEISRMTNTPITATVFTGAASQHIATKCGFETLVELDLTTYRFDGQIVYPKPRWPVIKWMAKRYF